MHWNYRICKHQDGHSSLHEVYYRKNGKEKGMTMMPSTFEAYEDEGPGDIIASLKMALRDAKRMPVFVIPKAWK